MVQLFGSCNILHHWGSTGFLQWLDLVKWKWMLRSKIGQWRYVYHVWMMKSWGSRHLGRFSQRLINLRAAASIFLVAVSGIGFTSKAKWKEGLYTVCRSATHPLLAPHPDSEVFVKKQWSFFYRIHRCWIFATKSGFVQGTWLDRMICFWWFQNQPEMALIWSSLSIQDKWNVFGGFSMRSRSSQRVRDCL